MAGSAARTLPLITMLPARAQSFELACDDMWEALRSTSVEELKALHPTGKFVKLVDALIDVRSMMQ